MVGEIGGWLRSAPGILIGRGDRDSIDHLCGEGDRGATAAVHDWAQFGQLADLVDRVREIAGFEWESPPVGRPHVLPLNTAVIAMLVGVRHDMSDEVPTEVVFGCSRATITHCHTITQPILWWVTRPTADPVVGHPPRGRSAARTGSPRRCAGRRARRPGRRTRALSRPTLRQDTYARRNVQVIADRDGRLSTSAPCPAPPCPAMPRHVPPRHAPPRHDGVLHLRHRRISMARQRIRPGRTAKAVGRAEERVSS